jgi:hypothetical protein
MNRYKTNFGLVLSDCFDKSVAIGNYTFEEERALYTFLVEPKMDSDGLRSNMCGPRLYSRFWPSHVVKSAHGPN